MRRFPRLLLALLLPVSSFSAEGDWGYAHINFIKFSLTEKWSVLSRSQVTWRDDFNDFYFWFIDAGLAYSITPAWRAELAYRQAAWNIQDEWLDENRPMANLDWFGRVKGVKLNNRARLEYRHYDWAREDDWRFRNRTRADFPWEAAGLYPYLEEEFFVGYNRGQLEMNWLTGGVQFKASGRLKLRAGYRWIAIQVNDRWENRNQLVTTLVLLF